MAIRQTIIRDNDILFLDFGPIVNGWNQTSVAPMCWVTTPETETATWDAEAWREANRWYAEQELTGATCFHYLTKLAKKYGWEWGGEIGGTLSGNIRTNNPMTNRPRPGHTPG